MKLGLVLSELRKLRNLPSARVAVALGVTRQRVFQIEGDNYLPSVRVLKRYADVLGVPAWEILKLAEQMPEIPNDPEND
jgi:transcriptional regulator with XRE-family HTH domain